MANSDKNIRITPNRNTTLFPKITFTGQSNNPITLNVLDDNSLSFEGSAGQLFSINNNLSSGYIFSINDISGLPSFRVNADGTVGIAEFFGNVGIGITNPAYKFQVRGDSYFASTGNTALLLLSGTGGTIIASNSVNITLTDPARKGLVINAANSQTANIFEWYADGGVGGGYSLAGTIRPSGQVHLGSPGLTMSNGGSALLGLQGRGSSEGLAIRGYNSNSTNPLFEIQGNAGNQLFGIYGDGGVNAPRINVTNGTASTSTTSGALIVTGGVGIGGTLNVNNIGIGYTGIPYSPSIAFIGTTGDPIRLNVLSNNTLSFEGRSGQLFSINNNLSSGWIFSVNDISGIPLFRANADATISMAEYAGNVGIGLSNPTFKFQVAGSASIGGTLNVNRLRVTSKITFEPGTGTSAVSGWTGIGLTSISKMIYAANRFVGVGGSYVAYSSDGVNFTYTTIPGQTSAASYGDIAYGNGVFVAVNAQNVNSTAYSYDGASWGTTSIATGIHRTVGFGNGKFFTTAEAGGNAYISTDGRNWSIVGNLGGFGREIYFANGYFLSPRGSHLYYSVDAASWKLANTPGSNSIFAITYGKGLYLAADYNSAQYYTSTDLVTWTRRTIDNLVWTGASYVNGVFYLIPNNNYNLYHSLDGINWSTTNFGTPIGGINKLFTANDRLYFYSSWNTTLWSTDATTGTLMAKPFYNGELENTRIGAVNPDSATFTNLTALNPVTFTSATASTGTDNGALVVTNGVGIGGTLNANTVNVVRDFNHTPNITTIGGASGWVASTVPQTFTPNSFKYLNNKYIGIGGTYIYYSDDLVNWSSVMVPNLDPARQIADITYGEGKYVFVQYYTGNAGYSTNLTNWTNAALQYNTWSKVVYGNGRFVADSGGSPYAYSLDGTSWVMVNDAKLGFSQTLQFINGYFYSCNSASLSRSIDGINWQSCNTTAIPYGLAYGNGLYVGGVYNSGTVVYSYDGLNFSSYSGTSYVHNNSWFYNGVYYLTTNNNNAIRYSTDGFNWSIIGGFPAAVNNLQYIKGRLYAGSGNTVWVTDATPGRFEVNPLRTGTLDDVEIGRLSPNNANFIDVSVNNNLNVSSQYDSASYLDGALTVAGGVGIGKTVNVQGSVNISNSLNLVNRTTGIATTWSRIVVGTAATIVDMAYANNLYVGVGYSSITSTDGVNWTTRTLPHDLSTVAFGNGIWSGLLYNTALGATSTNGTSWTSFAMYTTATWQDMAFGNGRFVAIPGNNATAAYSTNGYNWTQVSLPIPVGAFMASISFGGGYFFILLNANTTALYSSDGINWNTITLPSAAGWSRVTYGNGYYYITGSSYNGIYSSDLINWTTYGTDVNGTALNAYSNGTFVVTDGSTSSIIRNDFTAKTQITPPSTTGMTYLIAGDRSFLAGYGQTIYSFPIPNNSITVFPNTTGDLENVDIGINKPASGSFKQLNSSGLVTFGSRNNSTSPYNGALTVAGGVGIGGTLTANDVNVVSRLTSYASFGSTGGLGWIQATLPANYTEAFNSIVYGNGKFAAVGATAVLTSTDAVTWEVKNISWPSVPNSSSIKFLNSKFIVVAGNNSYIAYSDDAVTWQTSTTPVNSGSMVYNNGRYYKYSGSTVGISTNLSNWTSQTTNGFADRVLNGYFYSNGARSIDGINFESLVFPGAFPIDINYGNGIYFGAVYNSSIYYTSTDGLNFTQSTIESNVYLGAEYYNGVYYLRCQHNVPKLYYSLDGYNYSSVNLFSNQYNLSMAFGNNKIVYVGYNPSQINFLAYADATRGVVDLNTKFEGSIDNVVIGRRNARSASFLDVGISGKIVSNNTASSSTLSNNSAVFAGGVGIGQSLIVNGSVNISNSLNLVNSTTGIATTWTRNVVGTAATISYLAYANNLYVGVGYSSITSTDGVNWTTRTLPNNLSFVSYGNGIWSGLLFNSALGATSTNGTSWTSYAMTNNRGWTMMAFGNNTFVTLARNTNIAAYSTNGYNWTEVTMPTSQLWVWVTFGGGYFVAVANASTTAVYSTDGINWSTTTLPSAGGWNCVTYGNGYFYVTGSSTGGVYSKDLINWTNYSHTISGSAFAAYNNGAFVVADVNGATRTNIITGDFTSRTQIDLPGPQIPTALVAGDRNFIAGYGQTFYTFPIPNNSITLNPNTTGEINNVEIGAIKPAAGNFSNLYSQNIAAIGSTIRSTSPYNGALTVLGGAGIAGTLNANSVVTYNRLQNQSFSGTAIGTTGFPTTGRGSAHDRFSFGNGVFVSTSSWNNANAVYSTNGVNWISTTLPVNQGYPVNFFGNGYFVLAATGNTTVLYSTDGISWSQVSIGNTQTRTSGVYGNGKYVIVGTGTSYNYSSNLTSWSTGTLPLSASWLMAYGNGVFVALGAGTNRLIYSYDGINWNIGNVSSTNGANWTKVTYGNGKFVVSNFSGWATVISIDGINWFGTSAPSGLNGNQIGAEYGNGVYVITDDVSSYSFSIDGITWNTAYTTGGSFDMGGPTYGLNKFNMNGRYVEGPANTVTLDPKFTGEINNVRIGAITPASGDFTNLSSTGSANLVGTVNANNLNILSKVNQTPVLGGFAGTNGWTSANLLSGSSNNALTFGNGLFISILRASSTINFSSDGKRWTASTMPFVASWNDVAWGKDKFVAVAGVGTTGAFSGNGISWSSMSMPATAEGWYAVTYGDDKFVAVGNTSTSAYSSDGITWSGSSIANTNWTGIAYGNGTFVAVSGNGSSNAYSYDGLNWNYSTVGGVNNGVKFITYGNGYFVVTNYVSNFINYSRDGINWSTSTRTATYGIHTDLAYGNGIYSIFNYQETSYSYDAINWLNGNTIAATDWQAVAYGNNRFVATSINTSNVGSIDGPSNTLNLYPKFTGDIDNVRIGAKQPAAAEFTNLAAQQPVRFTSNTPSTNTTNGALMVLGGVGIGGSLNIGSDVIINGGRESNSTSTGSLIVRGGVGITGGLYVRPFSLSTKGLVVQANTSQTGNLFELQNSASSTITSFNASGELNITSTTGSTSAAFGSIVTAGGVGIGGSVSIGSAAGSASTTSGALKVVGGVGIGGTLNVGGSVNFSSSIFGGVSTSIVPTMTFIGPANDPITLSVLSDNSLSFDGSSGQLFSINNNLSTGWIFSISDISGLPLFRTNADGTVSMGEFGGNVGIGLTNPSYKLQVAGKASIGDTLFVTGNAHIGSLSFTDVFGGSYSPAITLTNDFAGDMVLQIQNKSTDITARAGLMLLNDANDYAALYMNSSDYAGIASSNFELYSARPIVINSSSIDISVSASPKLSVRDTVVTVTPTTESTSTTTGSLIINGGAGIAKSVNIGGFLSSKPAFITAGLATDQAIPSNTDQLLLFTDNTDSNGWWTGVAGSGVSHRFKPNIAGTYFVALQVHFKQTTGTGQMNIQARKNANTFSLAIADLTTTTSGHTLNATGAISMDGNTDYLDFTAYSNSSGSQTITGDAGRAWSQVTIYKLF